MTKPHVIILELSALDTDKDIDRVLQRVKSHA